MEAKGLRADVTLWVGAAWWEDCDPFVRIVAADAATLHDQIEQAIREEAERMLTNDDGPCEWCGAEAPEDGTEAEMSAWVAEHVDCAPIGETTGVESYRALVAEARKRGWWAESGRRELRELREGLREDGYAFLAD